MSKLKEKMMQLSDRTQQQGAQLLSEKVHPDVQKTRWEICLGCEHLFRQTSTCKQCGCFMQVKTWMPDQKCPIDKWSYSEIHTKKD